MARDEIKKLVADFDELIRQGQGSLVARRIQALNLKTVAREHRLDLANICRRVGLVEHGLRLLTPIVRPKEPIEAATTSERAEYAVLLQRTGATRNAIAVLNSLKNSGLAEVHLYHAYCHLNLWDEASALTHLRDYLKCELQPYARLVGEVNLAAALVAVDEHDEALQVLESCIAYASANSHKRLLGNCFELRAQVMLNRNQLDYAKKNLIEADELSRTFATSDQLWVRKWKAFIESKETKSALPILQFQAEARARSEWESLREADKLLLHHEFDQKRFDYLIFGTPYSSYRQRVVKQLQRVPSRYTFLLGDSNAPQLDLMSGTIDGNETLNSAKQPHRLLSILMRDFYKPIRLGALFSELFPEDHFDIFSSPDRVHQAIFRAKKEFSRARIPVQIDEKDGNYSLTSSGSISFIIPYESHVKAPADHSIYKLKEDFGTAPFAAKDGYKALKLSRTSFQRVLSWGIETGKVHKLGEGRNTRYKLAI